jgi:uncharacterized membrane protein YtjA (UPF0391 family)
MVWWAVVFAIIAAIGAIFGFTGVGVGVSGAAQILFVVFLVLFVAVVLLALWSSSDSDENTPSH